MLPNYSIFPGYGGYLKPVKKPYENLPVIKQLLGENDFAAFISRYAKWQQDLISSTLPDYSSDQAPIPAKSDREGYWGNDHVSYWLSGYSNWRIYERLYGRYRYPLRKGESFFELGCATGRILRHAIFQEKGLSVYGCDLNARHVDWMQQFLPKTAHIFQNSVLPILPLEDNSIDMAVAASVFTHIDDLESAWLMEMRRIMKRGGIFFATIMSDFYWFKCSNIPAYISVSEQMLTCESEFPISREMFKTPMPQKRIVLRNKGPQDCYNVHVFHNLEYIKEIWQLYFQIVDIIEAGEGMQDIVVLRKV